MIQLRRLTPPTLSRSFCSAPLSPRVAVSSHISQQAKSQSDLIKVSREMPSFSMEMSTSNRNEADKVNMHWAKDSIKKAIQLFEQKIEQLTKELADPSLLSVKKEAKGKKISLLHRVKNTLLKCVELNLGAVTGDEFFSKYCGLNPTELHLLRQTMVTQRTFFNTLDSLYKQVCSQLSELDLQKLKSCDPPVPLSKWFKAAEKGDVEVIRLFITLRLVATVDLKDEYGRTALMLAAGEGHATMVTFLLKSGAKLDEKDNAGETALMWAALTNHGEVVKLLFKAGASRALENTEGKTAFIWAAELGWIEVVDILNQNKAVLNLKNSVGMTPLMYASRAGRTGVVNYLLKNGADWKAKTKEGATAIIYAAGYGREKVVELFLSKASGEDSGTDKEEKEEAFKLAIKQGHTNVVRVFFKFQNDMDIDKRNIGGVTPLVYVAARGYDKIVDFFFRHTAIRLTKEHKEKAFINAVVNGHLKVVEVFLRFPGSIDINKKYNNMTPLMYAAYKGDERIVALLVRNGADVAAVNESNNTALLLSAQRGKEKTVEFLLRHSANRLRREDKCIAFMNAVINGCYKVVDVFLRLKAGVDVNLKYNNGELTALISAAKYGRQKVVKLLVEHGADLTAKDNEGKTALMWANERGHREVADLLSMINFLKHPEKSENSSTGAPLN